MGDVKKFRARKVHGEKLMAEALVDKDKRATQSKRGGEKITDKVEKLEKVDKVGKKKLRTKKISMSMTKAEEKKLDKDLEMDNKVSTAFIVIVLVLSFVVGISLGYILYKIALTGTV